MKLGPPLAMVAVVGLAVYLMVGPLSPSAAPSTPGAVGIDLVVANRKLRVEQRRDADAQPPERFTYRVLNEPELRGVILSEEDFQAMIHARGSSAGRDFFLRLFNVSSYTNLLWVALGLGAQALFAGRMWVQWIASERKRQSIVPAAFWYMSISGGLMLTAYFIWRQDIVGVLGQASGLVIYARNIRFVHLNKGSGAIPPRG
jgi:lipid-A-disaccharide synthase-like uncharacterized protein